MATEGVDVQGWQGCDSDTPSLKSWRSPAGALDAARKDARGHAHPQWTNVNEGAPQSVTAGEQSSLVNDQPDLEGVEGTEMMPQRSREAAEAAAGPSTQT